jgi:AcrR family transcriptional regulator
MERRAEGAEETRQKIVEATMALHAEQGVLATSHKDIAARADVSVGTVYHHFPSVDSIVRACGVHVADVLPLPSADTVNPRDPRRWRIESVTRAVVDFYARAPWFEKLRIERHAVPALDIGMSMREEAIRNLIRRALGRSPSAKRVRIVESILDTAVINHLLEFGMDQDEVASTLASIINAWLEGGHS